MKSPGRVGQASLVVALLLGTALAGCALFDLGGGNYLPAFWHQPGLLAAFPETGRYHGYDVGVAPTQGNVAIPGGFFSSWSGQYLTVTGNDDAYFSFSDRHPGWSSDDAWKHLRKMFDELSLPEPTLNPDFQFAQSWMQSFARWHQEEVWQEFPPAGRDGDWIVYRHEDLAVAERIDAATSQWVRADPEGNVSFRFESRFVAGTVIAYPPQEMRQEQTWVLLQEAFQALGLPEPDLEGPYEIQAEYWNHLDRV